MKCPKCGFEMQDEQLYCENCGNEIQIVPNFEPEIENSISETLNTLAEQLAKEEAEVSKEDKDDFLEEDPHFFDKLFSSNRKVFILCTVGAAFLIIVLFLIAFFVLQFRSKGYHINQAIEYADEENYDAAIACLNRAEEIDAFDADIYFLKADYYYLQNKETDAILNLKTIALTPGFDIVDVENAYSKLINIYRKNNDYQAINDLLLACDYPDIIYSYQSYMAYPPDFSYAEGTYQEVVPLKLSSNTYGNIYYTTDGSIPDESSDIYTTPIFLETGTYEIHAYFVNDYGIKSEMVTKTYIIDTVVPNAPEISVYSGDYTSPQLIEVTAAEGCTVYYTIDGTEPTIDSLQYTEPIPMPMGATKMKFVAYSEEGVAGESVTRNYNLKLNAQITINDALARLSECLVEQGYILDMYGHKTGIQGRYVYKCGAVYRLDGFDYYFIHEYYEDSLEVQSKTGRIFGVNITSGECGNIGLDEEANYYFAPF